LRIQRLAALAGVSPAIVSQLPATISCLLGNGWLSQVSSRETSSPGVLEMIPCIATLSIRTKQDRAFRLWIPLALIWLLLLPVVLLLLPLVFIACLAGRVEPFQALAIFWQILSSLNGANVEVTRANAYVSLHVF
jgi:hypothetical protein